MTVSDQSATSGRVVMIVLGARSGTSALAGTLGMLGGTLPKRLMGARSSNVKGHFEPQVIAALHNQLLAEVGSAWDDWRAFPQHWYHSPACPTHLARLRAAFLDDYGDFTVAVLKEPRMCRLLPLWWRLLQEVEARPAPVFIYRHPVEVAQSLSARDASTSRHGLLYWLRNQLDAELATRELLRSFVLFDELLEDWRQVVCRLEAALHVGLPKNSEQSRAEVDAFLEPALRHHRRPVYSGECSDLVTNWARAVFACLDILRVNSADQSALQELDRIRTTFDAYTSVPNGSAR
jgi:hypothetical protein